jgi:hypothetical protein
MSFFGRNIERTGRILRAISGIILLAGAVVVIMTWHNWWIAVILAVSGVFGLVEAFRGWCFLRACGIKTKY